MSARKLAIAADHAGAALKAVLLSELQKIAPDWEGIDLGGDGSDLTDDYPDASRAVAELMQRGGAERGLLICGSGIGVTIAANTFKGIRGVYFDGDMNAAPALAGQSAGLIHAVKPVQQIIDETVAEFHAITARLGALAASASF